MNVRFISIEVSIVRAAVSVMHTDGLFFGKHAASMRHDTRLMQSGLSVDEQRVAISQVTVHDLLAYIE